MLSVFMNMFCNRITSYNVCYTKLLRKERTQAALIEKINDSIQSELTENEMTVVESFSLDVIDEAAFAKVGDLKNSFDYQIKGKAKVFVVSHSDIEKVAQAQS